MPARNYISSACWETVEAHLNHFLRDLGQELLQRDHDAIRQRLRQQGLTDKLLYRARRFKTVLEQQPDWVERLCRMCDCGQQAVVVLEQQPDCVERLCHSVQADCLPTQHSGTGWFCSPSYSLVSNSKASDDEERINRAPNAGHA